MRVCSGCVNPAYQLALIKFKSCPLILLVYSQRMNTTMNTCVPDSTNILVRPSKQDARVCLGKSVSDSTMGRNNDI